MTHTIDPARWAQVEALPLPTGVGDLKHGLCAISRIRYALDGVVSDHLTCVSQVARTMIVSANDVLPAEMRQRLGRVDVRDALLATTPADDQRLRWVVAEQARQSALRALGYAGVSGAEVDALRDCAPITDAHTADAAARAAARAAVCAATRAADAAVAADVAAYFAACAAADATRAADAAACAEHQHRLRDVLALLGLTP